MKWKDMPEKAKRFWVIIVTCGIVALIWQLFHLDFSKFHFADFIVFLALDILVYCKLIYMPGKQYISLYGCVEFTTLVLFGPEFASLICLLSSQIGGRLARSDNPMKSSVIRGFVTAKNILALFLPGLLLKYFSIDFTNFGNSWWILIVLFAVQNLPDDFILIQFTRVLGITEPYKTRVSTVFEAWQSDLGDAYPKYIIFWITSILAIYLYANKPFLAILTLVLLFDIYIALINMTRFLLVAIQLFSMLAKAVEERDEYTGGHILRVAVIAAKIGKRMNLPIVVIYIILLGVIIHDLGKIYVPDGVLRKPASLTEEEFGRMKTHTKLQSILASGGFLTRSIVVLIGILERITAYLKRFVYIKAEIRNEVFDIGIVGEIGIFGKAIPIAIFHHERPDGKGYPLGLKSAQIPLGAKLAACADTWDAMTSDRPYRKGMPREKALDILKGTGPRDCYGSQLDTKVVDAFVSLYKDGKIDDSIDITPFVDQKILEQKMPVNGLLIDILALISVVIIGVFSISTIQGVWILLAVFALYITSNIFNYWSFKAAVWRIFRNLAEIVAERCGYDRGMPQRMVNYSLRLARALRLPRQEIIDLIMSALICHLGNVRVSDEALKGNRPMTEEEVLETKSHVDLELDEHGIFFGKSVWRKIRHHHENWDGTGYPSNLREDFIPLGARILRIIEAFVAMTSNRPHRKALTVNAAIAELRQNAGSQFDPFLVEVFIKKVLKR